MADEKSCGAIVYTYEKDVRKYVIIRGTGIYEVSEIALMDYNEAMQSLQYEESRRELTEAEEYLYKRNEQSARNL